MTKRTTPAIPEPADYAAFHGGIVGLLEAARREAARSVNALMTASYWAIGRCIVEFEQGGQQRVEYGEALLLRLSEDLSARFGPGFSRRNLQQMRLFYAAWPPERIWQTASAKSSAAPIRQRAPGKSVAIDKSESLSRNSIDPRILTVIERGGGWRPRGARNGGTEGAYENVA